MSADRWVEIEVEEVLNVTDRAVLCAVDGEEHWIPRSQIDVEGADFEAGEVDFTLSVTRWFAEKEGLV